MTDDTAPRRPRQAPLELAGDTPDAPVEDAATPADARAPFDQAGPTDDSEQGSPVTSTAPGHGWGSSRLLLYAAGFLLLAAFLFDLVDLVTEAAAFSTPLGLLVGAVTLVAAALVVKLSIDEFLAFRRLDRIDALRARGGRLLHSYDAQGGGSDFFSEIKHLYRYRTDLEDTVSLTERSIADYHNDTEIISFIDGQVLAPVDGRAYRLVMARARDTVVYTTLSPSPMLDAGLVLWQNLKLVRGVAALYGARPGYLGGIRLLKRMVASLAVAGLSESAQHLAAAALGGGLAAAVSTRVGQGLVNGLLTARIGLAAMTLCRPLPFPEGQEPSMSRIRSELLSVPKRLV